MPPATNPSEYVRSRDENLVQQTLAAKIVMLQHRKCNL